MKPKISAIVIAKNAQDVIEDCLDSLKFCDEILVVDSGSTDKTRDIARVKKAKVALYESNNFADLRNYGLKKVEYEWVLYIDTDERVTKELEESITYKISSARFKDIVAYKVQRKNFYLGINTWPTIENLERLFRRDALEGWFGELHESPKIKGPIGELHGFLLHYSHRDLTTMLSKTIQWSEKEARLRLDAKHSPITWWRFFRVFITGFFNSYISQKGYKAGVVGVVESMYQGFSMFITYARLWEMQQSNLKSQISNRKNAS